ncbi:MAG: NIL domain-containing protein [Elusimicrobiota bacterium]
MAGKKIISAMVKLTFPQALIKKPVIYTMAKKFNIIPNIRRGGVFMQQSKEITRKNGKNYSGN